MNERADRIRVHIENKEYAIVGGGFQEMLAAVKQVAGRRFVGELKVWQLPGKAEDIAHQLSIGGFELEGGTPLEEKSDGAAQPQGERSPQRTSSFSGGDRIRVSVNGQRLSVVGGAFREMLEAVKGLPSRRFDGETKIWEIPGEVGVIKGMIEAAGFQLEGAENIPLGTVPEMERPTFAATSQNPPPAPDFAPPAFLDEPPWDEDEIPDLEPPDWWDDDELPPPDMAYFEEPLFTEPDPFADAPLDFGEPAAPSTSPSSAPASGDRIRIRMGDIPLVVTGGPFKEMLTAIKAVPGRRFNGEEKVWEIPEDTTFDSLDQAMSAAGFTVLPG